MPASEVANPSDDYPESSSFYLISAVALGVAGLDFVILSRISFLRSSVIKIDRPELFDKNVLPGFTPQDRNSYRFRLFQKYLPRIGTPGLESAIAVRRWVRNQELSGDCWATHPPTLLGRIQGNPDDPFVILRAQRHGAWAVCRGECGVFSPGLAYMHHRTAVRGRGNRSQQESFECISPGCDVSPLPAACWHDGSSLRVPNWRRRTSLWP